jgi:glycosyltransferase involved in cell wall biosynthesis
VKVAVMMAAHNAERHVEAALASLLRQRDAAQLDIIVVNDGSTDGTAGILRRLAAEAPEIRLIETPNQGIVRTRNRLLDALAPDTDLVTTLDSDDISPPGRFVREIAPFVSDPALQMHYGSMLVFRGAGDDPLAPDFAGKTSRVRGIHLGALLARLSLMQKVGRFDERFVQAEDTDFLFRAAETRPAMLLSDEISYYYRRHETNISSDPAVVRHEFSRALHAAARRRRIDKVPGVPPKFFDFDGSDLDRGWF